MAPTVYLISGANRGIGLALVAHIAERADTVVFAGARNPSAAKDLQELEEKHPSRVHIVQLLSADKANNEAVIAETKQKVGRLDVVVANAGMSKLLWQSHEVPLDVMQEHYDVNVLGPLALFQAAYPLLRASTASPKFFIVSSDVGSIALGPSMPVKSTPYGASKAAVNWLAAKLWYEYPGLISLPLHPGSVDTDMAKEGLKSHPDLKDFPRITADESALGLIRVFDEAKRDETGPKLFAWNGEVLPW